jgi:hypothetical protein
LARRDKPSRGIRRESLSFSEIRASH